MTSNSGGEVTAEVKESETKESPPPNLFGSVDINSLAQSIATVDHTGAIRNQVMPIVNNFLSFASAAKHGKMVLEILEPFSVSIAQHLETGRKDLEARIPAVDAVFAGFVAVCPIDLKELGWPDKPLEKQLVPALIERSPVGEIKEFCVQLTSFRGTVDKLHQGDLLHVAHDAIRGNIEFEQFKTQLTKLFDSLAIIQKAFDFLWGLVKSVADSVMQLFNKVKEYAKKFTQAALAALEEFKRVAAEAEAKLAQALAAAEKAFTDTVGKAAELLAGSLTKLKTKFETELAHLKQVMTDSLAKVTQVYTSARGVVDDNFKNGTAKINHLFDEGVATAEKVANTAVTEARSLRDRATLEPKRKLADGRSKIDTLNREIASLAEKAKGSIMESLVLEGSKKLQNQVREITDTVCLPMEATIAEAEKQCEGVITRALECKTEAIATATDSKSKGLQTVQEEYDRSLQTIEKAKVDSTAECTRAFEDATKAAQTQLDQGTQEANEFHAKALSSAEQVKQAAVAEAESASKAVLSPVAAARDQAEAKARQVVDVIDTNMQAADAKVSECVRSPATALSGSTDNMFVAVLAKLEQAKQQAEAGNGLALVEEVVSKSGCCSFLASCFSRTPTQPPQPESQPLVNR